MSDKTYPARGLFVNAAQCLPVSELFRPPRCRARCFHRAPCALDLADGSQSTFRRGPAADRLLGLGPWVCFIAKRDCLVPICSRSFRKLRIHHGFRNTRYACYTAKIKPLQGAVPPRLTSDRAGQWDLWSF